MWSRLSDLLSRLVLLTKTHSQGLPPLIKACRDRKWALDRPGPLPETFDSKCWSFGSTKPSGTRNHIVPDVRMLVRSGRECRRPTSTGQKWWHNSSQSASLCQERVSIESVNSWGPPWALVRVACMGLTDRSLLSLDSSRRPRKQRHFIELSKSWTPKSCLGAFRIPWRWRASTLC